jgi:UDP:flavonoid glycosyltransferase YjiC (YdhE family)
VPHLEALFTAVDAELADADLLVSHPAASLVGAMACERRGIPWIVGDLFPMLVPTATGPPSGMPDLGATVNRAMWRLGRSRLVDPLTSRRDFVGFRRRLGLATDRRWNVVDARLSPYHNLALVSAHYVTPAADWPSNYRLVGFTSWSGPDAGRLPEEVERFLDDGPPPVAVTLGTSGATARPDVFERVADALDETRARGVFLTSNAAVTDRLRAAIQPLHGVWPFVSLAPLLPRTCGLVQSGAHGTNAIALEAGVPSVVVPCLFDQLWHARRQDELGTGIWARRRRHIPNAVQRLLQDNTLGEQARAMSAQLATEHGTHTACNEIEAFMSSA